MPPYDKSPLLYPKDLARNLDWSFLLVSFTSYLRRLASRSDSSKQRISSSRTMNQRVSQSLPRPVKDKAYRALWHSEWWIDFDRPWTQHALESRRRESLPSFSCHHQEATSLLQVGGHFIPVRPRTLTTLTSLTGILEESIASVWFSCCVLRWIKWRMWCSR